MKTPVKWIIVVAVAAAAVMAFAFRSNRSTESPKAGTTTVPSTTNANAYAPIAKLPKLVDLGANKCVPCKMMAPILEELKKEYSGRMNVEFIDVWQNPDAGKKYGIEIIPTQIFFDADGKELFRHLGFFAKADILGKWKELGVDVESKSNLAN